MPPDFLGKLRQLFVPAASPMAHKVTEETLKSPLADSLWAATGGGRPITAKGQVSRLLKPSALATYNPIFDMVEMRPEMLSAGTEEDAREEARSALMHEAGHRATRYRLSKNAPGGDALFKLPPMQRSQTAYGSPERRAEDREHMARSKVDKYYQTSPREGYAQAFEYAWQILTRMPKLMQEGDEEEGVPYDRSKYAEALADAEARRPGTGQIVSDLLKNEPMFRNHPLQAFYRSGGNR